MTESPIIECELDHHALYCVLLQQTNVNICMYIISDRAAGQMGSVCTSVCSNPQQVCIQVLKQDILRYSTAKGRELDVPPHVLNHMMYTLLVHQQFTQVHSGKRI